MNGHGRIWLYWRSVRFWWQRRTRGWDDTVTWNLDQQIAALLGPRLRRFRELNNGFPYGTTYESWNTELDEMCWAADWYAENAYEFDVDPKDYERAIRGLKNVMERLRELWW